MGRRSRGLRRSERFRVTPSGAARLGGAGPEGGGRAALHHGTARHGVARQEEPVRISGARSSAESFGRCARGVGRGLAQRRAQPEGGSAARARGELEFVWDTGADVTLIPHAEDSSIRVKEEEESCTAAQEELEAVGAVQEPCPGE